MAVDPADVPVLGQGPMVMVQPIWCVVTRGKEQMGFHDTNSRLAGWDWIKVDWHW